MCGDVAVVVPRCHDRAIMRRRLSLTSAVSFVLLAACALVCLSPTASGFRTPAAGTAGPHRAPGGIVTELARGSGSTNSSSLGPHANATSHHSGKPTNCTTKNASSVHIVFTHTGAEGGDDLLRANDPKDVPSSLRERAPPDPTVEATNTSVTTVDSKVQISFGNISAVRAQQFASSL
jgi:hypothetical protein